MLTNIKDNHNQMHGNCLLKFLTVANRRLRPERERNAACRETKLVALRADPTSAANWRNDAIE